VVNSIAVLKTVFGFKHLTKVFRRKSFILLSYRASFVAFGFI
jgi:hypothetical protein